MSSLRNKPCQPQNGESKSVFSFNFLPIPSLCLLSTKYQTRLKHDTKKHEEKKGERKQRRVAEKRKKQKNRKDTLVI